MKTFSKHLVKIPLMLLSYLMFQSCTADSEEDLLEGASCDTANIKYSSVVLILEASQCVSCHNSNFTNREGIVLDSYDALVSSVNTNRVLGAINHRDGFEAMPQGQDKLSDCDINKIEAWINAGMPQ